MSSGRTPRRRQSAAGVTEEGGGWGKTLVCPTVLKDYKKFMTGVDLSHAVIQYYSVRSKTVKWYKIIFIDISVVNSYIIFKMLAITRGETSISL